MILFIGYLQGPYNKSAYIRPSILVKLIKQAIAVKRTEFNAMKEVCNVFTFRRQIYKF